MPTSTLPNMASKGPSPKRVPPPVLETKSSVMSGWSERESGSEVDASGSADEAGSVGEAGADGGSESVVAGGSKISHGSQQVGALTSEPGTPFGMILLAPSLVLILHAR